MPRLNLKNNSRTTLSAGINEIVTSFSVANGLLLPDAPFRITVDNEIMEVGTKSGNTLSNVIRGLEGTTAVPHNSGAYVEVRFTTGVYDELETQVGAQEKANNAENNAGTYADGLIGSLASLLTSVKANIVAAINEVVNSITSLAGAGRTTETVKGNADMIDAVDADLTILEQAHTTHLLDFESHKADDVTIGDNPHGIIYEEGTFTPVIQGLTTAGSHTYNLQKGFYLRSGNKVFINLIIRMSTKDVAMDGVVSVGGLPFTPKTGEGALVVGRTHYITDVTSGKNTLAYFNAALPRIILAQHRSGNTSLDLPSTSVANNTLFEISGTYLI